MQLDYMVLADYVRQDGGVIHILGAGIDTIVAARVPAIQPLGIALRISFDAADPIGQAHHVKVSFIGQKPVLTVEAPSAGRRSLLTSPSTGEPASASLSRSLCPCRSTATTRASS